eukprot:m.164942 g.164942  ORF g.164942 m.164942 type:complete len:370 (-) comp12495_c0_seq1:3578-4687(-)
MADAAAGDADMDPFEAIEGFVAPLAALPPDMSSLRRYLACATSYDKQRSAQGIVLAYYIRMFATQLAINKFQTNKACVPYLMAMLDACEKCKPIVDGITDRDEMATYKLVEDAAVKIFYAADKADRAGKCDQRTAQAFMKASTLLEALTEVMRDAENDPKMMELDNYAKNKATYILKCIREGVQPQPGPAAIGVVEDAPVSDTSQPESWGAPAGPSPPQEAAAAPPPPTSDPFDYGLPTVPSSTSQPPPPSASQPYDYGLPSVPSSQPSFEPAPSPHSLPSAPPAPPAVSPPKQPEPMFQPAPRQPTPPAATPPAVSASGMSFTPKATVSIAEEREAVKAAKFAMSALQHSDNETAVRQLLAALKILCK